MLMSSSLLADLMIPEGAHDQNEDWTIFFLNQTPANTIAPPLDSEAPTPFIKHRRTYSKVLDQEVNPKPQLLYVLNLVRTKKDDTVPRLVYYTSEILFIIFPQRCSRQGSGYMFKTAVYSHLQTNSSPSTRRLLPIRFTFYSFTSLRCYK